MIQRLKNQRGFSLIEIILAVSIFALSITGLSGSLIYGQQASIIAAHREQAVFYANEGLEATQNIAENNFDNLTDGSFGLVIENDSYTLRDNSDTTDIYERQITISPIDSNTKQVISNVSWSQGMFDEGQVSFTTYVTNWK
jgi:prepilin-type N-terminal cleavage/methylation domain-containing protein